MGGSKSTYALLSHDQEQECFVETITRWAMLLKHNNAVEMCTETAIDMVVVCPVFVQSSKCMQTLKNHSSSIMHYLHEMPMIFMHSHIFHCLSRQQYSWGGASVSVLMVIEIYGG